MQDLPFHIAHRENVRNHPELRVPEPGDMQVESGIGRFYADKHVSDVYPGTVIRVRPGMSYRFEPPDLPVVERRVFH